MSISEMPVPRPAAGAEFHTSALLQHLIDEAPRDTFTLDWLVGNMPHRSFGVIILLLALLTLVPIVSIVARLVLLVLALQIMVGYASPVLPRRLMRRRLSARYLTRLKRHAIPALEHLETFVRPRWCHLLSATRRAGAFMAFILILISLVSPLPLANMPVAVIIMLMALAYIEHDGVLLFVAHLMGFAFLILLSAAILEAMRL